MRVHTVVMEGVAGSVLVVLTEDDARNLEQVLGGLTGGQLYELHSQLSDLLKKRDN